MNDERGRGVRLILGFVMAVALALGLAGTAQAQADRPHPGWVGVWSGPAQVGRQVTPIIVTISPDGAVVSRVPATGCEVNWGRLNLQTLLARGDGRIPISDDEPGDGQSAVTWVSGDPETRGPITVISGAGEYCGASDMLLRYSPSADEMWFRAGPVERRHATRPDMGTADVPLRMRRVGGAPVPQPGPPTAAKPPIESAAAPPPGPALRPDQCVLPREEPNADPTAVPLSEPWVEVTAQQGGVEIYHRAGSRYRPEPGPLLHRLAPGGREVVQFSAVIIKTGVQSRATVRHWDNTVMRVGANTLVWWAPQPPLQFREPDALYLPRGTFRCIASGVPG